MRTIYLLLVFLGSIAGLSAQPLNMELLKNMKARSIGPAGMSGRVTAIDAVHDNPDIIYVGTASGGLWKSVSGGVAWEPIFDDQTTASIGAIAIQQSNPSVIWVGTGEGNPRNSLNGGDGIYRSLDGGKNWQQMGLEGTRHIHRVIIDPTNPLVVYLGAIGAPWGEHEERGVYKTTDGGTTWSRILHTNIRSGVADLVMDPTNPNKLLAAMWEHKRDPWFFKSGGPGSGLYMTHDGGQNWKKLTEEDGLPKGELGRIGLAIAPSMPNRIYALIESKKNALYRSDDGGFTWSMINDKSDIGNRPFYYSDIAVDPSNENRVFSIFTYVNVSEDGGKSFAELMPAYGTTRGVHPDHHAWWIDPNNPDFMMDGNDGGLNITRDRGKTWRFVENLPVGQFYHVAVDNDYPYNVYGGMQDNGSWAGPAYVWKAQGIRNDYWQEISFGDGFDVLPDPTNSRFGISTAQQGSAGIYDRETGYFELVRPTAPDRDVELRFNWNAGMARDPFDPQTIYFGSQFVHKSTDGGQNWEIISPDLTTNDPGKQKQGDSGGLTMDATGAENYCTILVIAPSPVQQNVLWVGTDDGKVHISQDGGASWTDVSGSLPNGIWVTQIQPDANNAGEAMLVANDYRRFNYEPMAWRTRDYGQSWQRIVDADDVASYTLAIVEDAEEPRLKFLGTDDGLYVSVDDASNWTKWIHGFPTTNAMDLVIHPREQDLVIATFGRAMYVLDDIRPLREVASAGTGILSKTLHVFDPPTAYLAANQQATGTRFGADATYNGENRPDGAMLSYVLTLPEKTDDKQDESTADNGKGKRQKRNQDPEPATAEKDAGKGKDEVKYDSLIVEIFSGDEVIRTIKSKAPEESGLTRMYWDLREQGVARLSREPSSRPFRGGSGPLVTPGTYKVRVTFGDAMDSTELEVQFDPRLDMTTADLQARYDAAKRIENGRKRALTAVNRIHESLSIADEFSKRMSEQDKEGLKDQIELCKTTTDTLNTFLDGFFGKEDERQGITKGEVFTVDNYLGAANRYTNNALHRPGATELRLIEKFETELQQWLDAVNGYYEEAWPSYREAMESVDLNPFKDYEKIE